ncbi:MAG: hypothetical protein Q9195_007104 [Heterodermia aff. obscurata]
MEMSTQGRITILMRNATPNPDTISAPHNNLQLRVFGPFSRENIPTKGRAYGTTHPSSPSLRAVPANLEAQAMYRKSTTLLSTLLLLRLPTPVLSISMICYSPATIPPLTNDCFDLLAAIKEASHLPSKQGPKDWGRRLPNSDLTESLPKLYYIKAESSRPMFSTCAVEVDADPIHTWAVETFTLAKVGKAAEAIVDKCLEDHHMVGLATLGETGKVQASLFRTNRPMLGVDAAPAGGKNVGGGLWVVEGDAARGWLLRNATLVNGTVEES